MKTSFIKCISFTFLMMGCASKPQIVTSTSPVDTYIKAKNGESTSEYSLEYLKSQAAMYLLSQGKTELKAGNSALAVKYLSQAREYNPWNDEIKDLYILSIKFLIKSTQSLQQANCDIINDRLSLIYLVANDQINQLQDLASKCNFDIKTRSTVKFNNLTLPSESIENEKKIYVTLEDQANAIILRNQNPPIRELLYLAMDFISSLRIITGEPKISELSDDQDNIKILVPISFILTQPRHSEEFCLKTKELLSKKEFEDEVYSPNYMGGALGLLKCRYITYETKFLEFATNPNWHKKINFYPIPRNTVLFIKFKYKDGKEQSFINHINTNFNPENVELRYGFNFDFIEGDLPMKLNHNSQIQKNNNYLEITTNLNNVRGLESISIDLDLDRTFKSELNKIP